MNNGTSGNSGYLALGRESAIGVPVAATHAIPLTEETLNSELNTNGESLVFGSKAARLLTLLESDHMAVASPSSPNQRARGISDKLIDPSIALRIEELSILKDTVRYSSSVIGSSRSSH
ncbi:hypothetical protein [Rhodococcus sp. DN22]|uniref:hypothetical protein n=1 Tax=Rhodococcus sp. DN22 TaxID=357684 RepID=UPI0030D28BB6